VFQPGVPLHSTPPSAVESKLPARESFQATWLHLRIRRSGIGAIPIRSNSSWASARSASRAASTAWRIVTLEQRRIVFVHLDEFDQALNTKVGQRQDAVFPDAIDPDDTVLDFHFIGNVPQLILGDAGDVMDLVDVRVVTPLEPRSLTPEAS
jgi:hypothetical protein